MLRPTAYCLLPTAHTTSSISSAIGMTTRCPNRPFQRFDSRCVAPYFAESQTSGRVATALITMRDLPLMPQYQSYPWYHACMIFQFGQAMNTIYE
jgi:hypothetical protein